MILPVLGSTAWAATLQVPAQYPTIQNAVDAAVGGDEIIVAAGVYEEQVVITKNIIVTGAGVGLTTLLAPVFMPHTTPPFDYNAVVHVEQPATSAVLQDFSVEGAGRARSETLFVGIMFDRAGGTAQRLDIQNFHPTPVSTAISGVGFYVRSEPSDGLDLLVSDVNIQAFQKAGFGCYGSGLYPVLRNVVVDATTLYTDAVQNGFELLNGTSGTLIDCTARGCWYDGTPIANTTSVGFLFYYAKTWTIDGCHADENQSGFYSIGTDLIMSDTDINGSPRVLNFNYGLVVTGPVSGLSIKDIRKRTPTAWTSTVGQPLPLTSTAAKIGTSPLGTSAVLDNCRIIGEKVAGSLGVLAYSNLDEVALEMENGSCGKWGVGVLANEDPGGWVVSRIRSGLLENNVEAAVLSGTFQPVDARGNYWNDPSGPYHSVLNPSGLGDNVGDNVVFEPWLHGNVICAPAPLYISGADTAAGGYSGEVTVRYLGGLPESVYGFSAEVTWDQSQLTATTSDISRPDGGLFQSAALFQVMPITAGFRVDGALGGTAAGIAAGELFKIRFHLLGQPDGKEVPIALNVHHLRNNLNQEVEGYVANDGFVIGDVKPPSITNLQIINSTLPHTNAFAKQGDLLQINATITDGDPLFEKSRIVGNFIYLFGVSGYLRHPDSLADGEALWLKVAATIYPPDDLSPYSVTATDPAGNTITLAASITADNTPPQVMTGLMATTDHNRIELQWDDPGLLETNVRQVVVRAAETGDYPFYALPPPVFPSTATEGLPIYAGLDTTTTVLYSADGSARDIVSFQAFVIDQVDLVSPAGPTAQVRARNYLLADVTAGNTSGYDALTDIYDVTRLGDTFGLAGIESGFNAECDVGPTDDATSAGLPLPDGVIDLEDLMIFADRFDVDQALVAATATPPGGTPELVWRQDSPREWVLELATPYPTLKGLRLTSVHGLEVPATVLAGDLLRQQPDPLLLNKPHHSLDVSLAVMGPGVGLVGSGELLRVKTDQPVADLEIALDVRSVTNGKLAVQLSAPVPAPLPVRFALHGNHPNPFNPATTISFDLPRPQSVRLIVYTVDGRRVDQLKLGVLPAGVHDVVWHGRDRDNRALASGLYLYRLEAGPWSATGKMNLVK